MAAPVYSGNDNVNNKRQLDVVEHNVSTNPFWPEMTETARATMSQARPMSDLRGPEPNPFLISMELTTFAQNEHCGVRQQSWLLTPPPLAHTNPLTAPMYTAGGEVWAVHQRGNVTPVVPTVDANNNNNHSDILPTHKMFGPWCPSTSAGYTAPIVETGCPTGS